MGPGDLQRIMEGLARPVDPRVLVGTETGDDAGVVRLDDSRGLVLTADFITPPLDDPYRYGQIAAANSLSDVFAMGGRAIAAVALCAFPKDLHPDAAREILAGGQAKAWEAGCAVVGGHTVRNPELFYGLSVTGVIDLTDPARLLRNVGARPGDALVLTKALGTGLVINGRRKGLTPDAVLERAVLQMIQLNARPSEAALAAGAHACTDITGFGLVGHALKMALGSAVRLRLHADALPVIDGALDLARQGVTTGSTKPNREAVAAHLRCASPLPSLLDQILHDPQTSGGLLIAVPSEAAAALVARLVEEGARDACVIGEALDPGAASPAGIEIVGDDARYAD